MHRIFAFILALVILIIGLFYSPGQSLKPLGGSDRVPPSNNATTHFARMITLPGIVRCLAFIGISGLVLSCVVAQYGAIAALIVVAALGTLFSPQPSCVLGVAAGADRNTDERPGDELEVDVAADTIIYAGTIVARDANGDAVPASDTAGLRVMGRAEAQADNTDGAAGDIKVKVRLGCFKFANSATAAIDADDLGKMAVVEDDQTVAETSTNLVCAGRITGLDDDGANVWIDTRHAFYGPRTLPTLGSTNGTFAAAADDAAVKVEGEKVGDDVRALHSSIFG